MMLRVITVTAFRELRDNVIGNAERKLNNRLSLLCKLRGLLLTKDFRKKKQPGYLDAVRHFLLLDVNGITV